MATLHVLSYLVAGAFLIRNAHVPGLPVIGVGAALNAITVTLNGGTLPASAAALRAIGAANADQPGIAGATNSGGLVHPIMPWLGDVFAVPAPIPLANVFSIGDVLIVGGALFCVFRVCGTRWTTLGLSRDQVCCMKVPPAKKLP